MKRITFLIVLLLLLVSFHAQAVTQRFRVEKLSGGTEWAFKDILSAEQTFASGDTTPSVSGGNMFSFHADAATITDFDDGVAGQIIYLRAVNANTDLTDGGNLALAGNFTGDGLDMIVLIKVDATTWLELSRSAN